MEDMAELRDVWVYFEDTNGMERISLSMVKPDDIIAMSGVEGYWIVKGWPTKRTDGVWQVMVEREVR